ncbi:helicase-associated domain-containing protein [Wenjunlia tyrosinilytica]|uniref:DNA-binding protein n=1 Tax=Wenjunlia tyrosinilytica TaxID=1544741 RepID=A0A918DXI4_9ACTN|nr:helicase-associated domain-containing protein [Wenjunlia tyrosinilytica]GGO86982.1 hypothetical protein GCM10012280_24400 [Wenjunlia tyrosinilytica]
MSTEQSTAPRTLAEDLRARDDEALSGLLRARPDLLSPVPNDLTQLATRAGTRASVVRALERLDRFTLQTAEAMAVGPDGCDLGVLGALMPDVEAPAVEAAVERLRERALVWGSDERLRLVRTARDMLAPSTGAPSPTGLGPTVAEATSGTSPGRMQELLADAGLPATHDPVSAVASLTALFSDAERMDVLLASAPRGTTEVLGKLTWGPPYGETPDAGRHVRAADAVTPVQWLLARGLLLPSGPGNVVLPREAGLYLRGGRAHRHHEPVPPSVEPVERDPQAVDAAAAGQAFTAVRTVEELLKRWDTGGPAVLRAGGLSVRDLKRTAAALDLSEQTAAFWLEVAFGAGLLASDGDVDEEWAPTPAYDEWRQHPTERRWEQLAAAWLTATRVPGLVGTKDSKGRVLAALGPDLDRSLAAEVRRRLLALLAGLPEGGAAGRDQLLARLRWDRPLRDGADGLREQIMDWTLLEAELLGVTGRGALSSHGRALLSGGHPAPLLAPLLPQPLDHVLLQADLTAVAPGPLVTHLAETLAVAADVESKGGATVFRFTPESVRRALDAGRSASDLHAFLAEHSRTPVPQPLTYLIDDVARKHGRLRVGAASAYLRCDDDALLAELLADRRSSGLGLRRLAPTVLAAQAPPDVLLERLRSMGCAPAAESADGDVLIARADAHRTPPRSAPVPVPEGPPVPDAVLLGAAVKAIRAGDRASTATRRPAVPAPADGGLPRSAAAETLAAMQAAVMVGETVWIGYVNADGAASQRVIAPVRVEGGFVTAYDHTTDEVRTFALHRVTGVAELADEPA